MLSNNLRLTIICLVINFIDAGFITQMGLLSGPIATAYNVDITSAAFQFTMLTGGMLIGSVIAYFLLDYFGVKLVVLGSTIIIVFSTLGLYLLKSFAVLPVLLGLIGVMQGISVVIAGLIISKIWIGKKREAFFIGQDAAFNLGGFFFPFITTYILSRHMSWELCYIFVVTFAIIIIYLSLSSNFSFEINVQEETNYKQNVEWNSGVLIAGICLFLVILGKYTVVLWLPHFTQTSLLLSAEESSRIISTIFSTALLGTVAGIYIITKVPLAYFMCTAILIGFLSSMLFGHASSYNHILFLAAIFGITISVLFNVFIVYGLSFVTQPSHKHISFILFCSGVGGAVTPYISSLIVEQFDGAVAALYFSCILYGVTFLILVTHEMYRAKHKKVDAKI